MTTPNFTPDWTKTGDVFVDRVGNEYRNPQHRTAWPWSLEMPCGGRRLFTASGAYHSSYGALYDYDIVSQYTPAPAPQGVDVPQWCVAAFAELRDRGYFNYSHHSESITGKEIINIIAKHAPQPEATPATAADGEGEVQATTPKWPRYFEPKELRGIRDRIKFIDPFHPVWADGSSSPVALCRSVKDIDMNDYIETDANGNALTQPIEQQQASGVEAKVDEVVTLAQDAAFARRDKSLFMVKEGSKFVPADRFIEAEAELASIKREYLEDASTNRQRIDDHEVLIARLRRRLAARDATIAELTKSGEQASSIRDGALAVCKNSHELVLGLINERNGLKKQLAAANERVAALEKELKGWHGVVVECEKILKAVGTAERPLTSNLPNLIRDRLQSLHRAEEAVAELEKERDGLRKALSYLHERLTEYKNGEAMIYADARGDIAVIEKALAQPSAEVGK